MTRRAAAPSQFWLDVAAVTRPSGSSGRSAAIFSSDVSRRGQVSVATAPYAAISRSNQPPSVAVTAR
jgi:hypothetical protein